MIAVTLTMTAAQHGSLEAHLFPGDGKEAVAVLLCGRRAGTEHHRLVVQDILYVPYERCTVREPGMVQWPTDVLDDFLERATKRGLALVKIHSHPTGYPRFSRTDDTADRDLIPSIYAWVDGVEPHGSAIMLPGGEILGRVVHENGTFEEFATVNVVGDDLVTWRRGREDDDTEVPAHAERVAQAFGKKTLAHLSKLRVAVVGCSGTGSLVAEALARNGVGTLVLVDPERIEDKNLNRIVNAGRMHVGRLKVDVLQNAIHEMGLGTKVVAVAGELGDPGTIRMVADSDVLFGCVDGTVGRHLLNRIATYYLIPYFDVGVKLAVDEEGLITRVEAAANYVRPDGATLMDRGLYTTEELRAEWLKRGDPEEYARLRTERYIKGVNEDQPAVITVNMLAASLGVDDLIARIHKYRDVDNAEFERQTLSLYLGIYDNERITKTDTPIKPYLGRGDEEPLLGMPELSEKKRTP